MAAEAAGRAYITPDEGLKARLLRDARAWVRRGERADVREALAANLPA